MVGNEVVSKFLKSIFLILFVLYSGFLSGAESYPTYFSPDHYSSSCDIYIKDNAKVFQKIINKIKEKHQASNWDGLTAVKNDGVFKKYVNKLSECADVYRFTNNINYFRTSHAYIMLFLEMTRKDKIPKKTTSRVNGVVSDINDDIEKILISGKIDN